MEIIWYGVEQFSGFLHSGNISFLAIVVVMVLLGLMRYYIAKR